MSPPAEAHTSRVLTMIASWAVWLSNGNTSTMLLHMSQITTKTSILNYIGI